MHGADAHGLGEYASGLILAADDCASNTVCTWIRSLASTVQSTLRLGSRVECLLEGFCSPIDPPRCSPNKGPWQTETQGLIGLLRSTYYVVVVSGGWISVANGSPGQKGLVIEPSRDY